MSAEPDPALRLLWRHVVPAEPQARRGPKQKVTVDEVVDAAIELADRDGLSALSMRVLAQRLGLGAMTLYSYVPGRNELIALMVDQAIGRAELPELPEELRGRLEQIARHQYDLCRRHPWLMEVSGLRPWLGPQASEQYEWQLSAIEGVGLDDVEMDQTVALLSGYATSIARALHEVRRTEQESGLTELEWWEANAEALGEVMQHRSFPLAGRVGTAAGEAYQAATDPVRELEFGLARIVDGLLVHLERKRENR